MVYSVCVRVYIYALCIYYIVCVYVYIYNIYSNYAVYIISTAPTSRFSCNIFLQQPSLQRAIFLPF